MEQDKINTLKNLINLGKITQAENLFQNLIKHSPDSPTLLNLQCIILIAKKNIKKLKKIY